jgi:acetyl-CoA carboxylase biotin carboxyl carrier protein
MSEYDDVAESAGDGVPEMQPATAPGGPPLDELLAIMREHDLDALTVRLGGATYELVRRSPATPAPAAAPVGETTAPDVVPLVQSSAHFKKVAAPVIGVFYAAPAPGAEPFVSVGDRVEVGDVLCILEAMKLMNEITSDFAGIVRRVLPENGALVSLGEELFWIEP